MNDSDYAVMNENHTGSSLVKVSSYAASQPNKKEVVAAAAAEEVEEEEVMEDQDLDLVQGPAAEVAAVSTAVVHAHHFVQALSLLSV